MSESTPLFNKPNATDHHRDADDLLETAVTDAYVGFLDDDDEDDDVDDEVLWIREQREQNKTLPWMKRPSVWMICLCTFLGSMATSAAEPTRTGMIFKLSCNYLMDKNKSSTCNPEETQVLVSNLSLATTLSMGLVTMIVSGKVGTLSDIYGRKLFVSVIIGSMILGKTILFFTLHHFNTLPFYSIITGDLVASLGGGIITLIALTNSYISDVVEAHERIYSLGLSIASLYIGLSIGPMVGNLLLTVPKRFLDKPHSSPDISEMKEIYTSSLKVISSTEFIPLRFEIGLLAIVFIYCVFVLPESRSEKARHRSRTLSRVSMSDIRQFREEEGNDCNRSPFDQVEQDSNCRNTVFGALFKVLDFFRPLLLLTLPADAVNPNRRYRIKKDRLAVIILVIIDCVNFGFSTAVGNITVLYGLYKFNWTSIDIGHFMTIACSSRAIVLIILSPMITHTLFHKKLQFKIFKRQFDMVDFSISVLGFSVEFLGFVLLYFARSSAALFVVFALQSIGSLTGPTLNSAIIKHYPESKVGAYFGAISILKNALSLLSPLIFVSFYKMSITEWHQPQLVFALLALISFIFLCLLIILKRLLNLDSNTTEDLLLRSQSISNSRRTSFSSETSDSSSFRDSLNASVFESDPETRYTSPVPGSSRGLSREFARSNSFLSNQVKSNKANAN
ncbi:hypothetical protein CLIB1423_02S06612 [[Candida] railenensis]|uniref:Major facilitator superfamily (MFS) profile domain-containing protein n=1 Tax=[Candida] railenensis TaxID=45579 RepID=A0A9P0VWX2_9ASCO|nr:hypothetical protein CLIB1423_02S06612 [[Candida] railenensis]